MASHKLKKKKVVKTFVDYENYILLKTNRIFFFYFYLFELLD